MFIKVAVQEAQDQNAYLTRCLQAQADESMHTENLLLQFMKTTKSMYLTLRVQEAVPSYMEADFNVIKKNVTSAFVYPVNVELALIATA